MGIENRGNKMKTREMFKMRGTPASARNVPDSEQRQFSTFPLTQDLVKLLIRLFTSKISFHHFGLHQPQRLRLSFQL